MYVQPYGIQFDKVPAHFALSIFDKLNDMFYCPEVFTQHNFGANNTNYIYIMYKLFVHDRIYLMIIGHVFGNVTTIIYDYAIKLKDEIHNF